MTFDGVFSVAMLGACIWALRFVLPKALKEGDGLGIVSAVLTAIFALIAWLLVGTPVRALP